MSESLYFIAVLPPDKIQEEITGFKHEITEKYESKHALRSPPHITLHMPFKWKNKRYGDLIDVMTTLNSDLASFEVQLKDFGFFEPRVVFVDVVKNKRLNELQENVVDACRKKLKLNNANYKNRPFHPHITIGFRDLKKRMFYKAKKAFEDRSFSCEFWVEEVALLKHDGKKWNVTEF